MHAENSSWHLNWRALLCTLALVFPYSVIAAPGLTISASVQNPDIVLSINLTGSDEDYLSGMQFDLQYDAAQYALVGYQQGSIAGQLDISTAATSGSLRVLYTPQANDNSNTFDPVSIGQLLTVTFNRVSGAPFYDSTFSTSNIAIGNSAGAEVIPGTSGSYFLSWGPDNEGDGIPDSWDTDDDNDGMPDSYEIQHGLDPLVDDANQDPDSDGLTNLQEYQVGTDPFDSDTDNDGVPDGQDPQPTVNIAVIMQIIQSLLLSD